MIIDLITVALDEAEETLPYAKDCKIVSKDKFGDPIYEDIGMTPKFVKLTNIYTAILNARR